MRPRKPVNPELLLDRPAYTLAQFCARNQVSVPTYNRLRDQQRGPREMRLGINMVRITAEDEHDWRQLMKLGNEALALQATKRALKAGDASAKSDTCE